MFTELLWPQALLLVMAYLPCFPTEFIPNIITGAHPMPESVSWIHAQYLGFPLPIILIFPISAFLFLEIQPRIQFFMMRCCPMHIFLLLLFVFYKSLLPTAHRHSLATYYLPELSCHPSVLALQLLPSLSVSCSSYLQVLWIWNTMIFCEFYLHELISIHYTEGEKLVEQRKKLWSLERQEEKSHKEKYQNRQDTVKCQLWGLSEDPWVVRKHKYLVS